MMYLPLWLSTCLIESKAKISTHYSEEMPTFPFRLISIGYNLKKKSSVQGCRQELPRLLIPQ